MAKTIPPIDIRNTKSDAVGKAESIPDYRIFLTDQGNWFLPSGPVVRHEGGQSVVLEPFIEWGDDTGKKYAIKVYKEDVPQATRDVFSNFADLPYILLPVDQGHTDGHVFYIIPYMTPILDAAHMLCDFESIIRMVSCLNQGLYSLHNDAGVLHGDLSPDNIYISSCGDCFIGDLGSVIAIECYTPGTNEGCHVSRRIHLAKPGYTDPRKLLGFGEYLSLESVTSDYYSLGASLASLISRRDIFSSYSELEYLSMLREGEAVHVQFPENLMLNAEEKEAIRALIDALTDVTRRDAFGYEQVNAWIMNPLECTARISSGAKRKTTGVVLNPKVYFNRSFHGTAPDLARAFTDAYEEARSFVVKPEFSMALASSSVVLAGIIARVINEYEELCTEHNDDESMKAAQQQVLVTKIIKMLDPSPAAAFLVYDGVRYPTVEDISKADAESIQKILEYSLLTFAIESSPDLVVEEAVIEACKRLQDHARDRPELYFYTVECFRRFLNQNVEEETGDEVVIEYLNYLFTHESLIYQLIDTEKIGDCPKGLQLLADLSFCGFETQTKDLLEFLIQPGQTKYEKLYTLCNYFEMILTTIGAGALWDSYIGFLAYSGPDSWMITFTRDVERYYYAFSERGKEKIQMLSDLHTCLLNAIESRSVREWKNATQRVRELYSEFFDNVQDNRVLASAGIRAGGKSIFPVHESAFFTTSIFEQPNMPIFCTLS